MAEPARAKPKPTPETQHFWDGTQAGELRLQRCDACANAYFPPRPFCPGCGVRKVSVFKASGKGTLYSYVIHHRPRARLYAALRHCRGGARGRSAHDEQHRRLPADARGARTRHEAGSRVREARRQDHPALVPSGEGLSIMRRNQVAVVGAAETTELGVIPNMSQIQLHADAALNAIADAGLKLSDIDGLPPRSKRRSRSPIISASRRPGSTAHRSAAARSCCMSATPLRRSRRACARPC